MAKKKLIESMVVGATTPGLGALKNASAAKTGGRKAISGSATRTPISGSVPKVKMLEVNKSGGASKKKRKTQKVK